MTLRSPIVTVTLETEGDQHRQITVQTDNRNQVQFDMLRARRGYPAQSDAPVLWLTVIAWHALTLAGELPPNTEFETFNRRCLEVFLSDEEGNPLTRDELKARMGVQADPTQPDREPGI